MGEYSGQVKAVSKQTRALGMFSSDYAKTSFTVASPRLTTPMTVSCEGGQNRFGFSWIDFKRNDRPMSATSQAARRTPPSPWC